MRCSDVSGCEVTLWHWSLADGWMADAAWWRGVAGISEDEWASACSRRHPGAARSFLAGRALARRAVAAAGGLRPRDLRISGPAQGKPRLLPGSVGEGWQFNIAHSGNEVVCAVARMAVGVDVEPLWRRTDHELVATARFGPDEAAWVAAGRRLRGPRFTALWTVKEAYAKGLGQGLALPMRSVHVQPLCVDRLLVGSQAAGAAVWHAWLRRLAGRHWLVLCTPVPARPSLHRVQWPDFAVDERRTD